MEYLNYVTKVLMSALDIFIVCVTFAKSKLTGMQDIRVEDPES